MTEPILVTGGTGDIGRRIVPRLRAAGRDVRVLSRRGGIDSAGIRNVIGDTRKNEGLDAAFRGARVVLHLAGGAKGDDTAAGHVVAAARLADAEHLVLVSVIGAGQVPVAYLRMKAAAEDAIAGSGIPFTILRVAQLHSLLLPVVRRVSRLPLVLAPRDVRLEPVDGEVVAARLAGLALGSAAGRVSDLAGPEVRSFGELLAQVLEADGRSRRIVEMPLPGAVGRAYRSDANLTDTAADREGMSWREFIDRAEPART